MIFGIFKHNTHYSILLMECPVVVKTLFFKFFIFFTVNFYKNN